MTLASLALIVGVAGAARPARAADFFVKSATYSGTTGLFGLEASLLPADGRAVLTIAITGGSIENDAAQLIQSIRSSVPAQIVAADKKDPPRKEISISVHSATAVTAQVSYAAKIDDISRVSYEIDIKKAEIHGFATIKDESKSNASWSNATITIRRDLGDLQFTVDLPAQSTVVRPIPSVANNTIKVAENQALRLRGTRAFQTLTLENLGPAKLQSGQVRLIENGAIRGLTSLTEDLDINKPVELLAEESTAISVGQPQSVSNLWREATSLTDGKLKFKKASGNLTTLKNTTSQAVAVQLGSASDAPRNIGAAGKLEFFQQTLSEDVEADLLDLTEAKLVERKKKLKEIETFSVTATQCTIASVITSYENILSAKKEVKAQTDSKAAALAKIGELMAAPPSAEASTLLEYLRGHLGRVTHDLRDAQQQETEDILKLFQVLLP